MHAQEVDQAMATTAAQELQAVIADKESEFQQMLGDLRTVARNMGDLSVSGDVTDEVLDTLRWTVDSVRTELQEARQIVRGAADRVSEAAALLRQFG
jgi:hypothetical protein